MTTKLESRFASRKWTAWWTLTLVSLMFPAQGWCTGPEWLEFAKWLFGLYLAGNVSSVVAQGLTVTAKSDVPR